MIKNKKFQYIAIEKALMSIKSQKNSNDFKDEYIFKTKKLTSREICIKNN